MSARRRRTAAAAVLAMLAAPLAVVGLAGPAQAAVIDEFAPVFSANTNGEIALVGNTLMSCVTGAGGCAGARSGSTASNNSHASAFVDVDGPGGMFNSSSATLDVPTGGGVLFAALVWGGRIGGGQATADSDLRDEVRIVVPGGAAHDIVATDVQDMAVAADVDYKAYADVTDIVAAAGEGSYTVGNVQSRTGGTDQYAGWSLVVAMSDPEAPARNLTIFSGYGQVDTGGGSMSIPVSGFLTPPAGPVETTLGVVTFEGDAGYTGDSLELEDTVISDGLSTADNAFNSTISTGGVDLAARAPAYANQLGFDIDHFTVPDGVLGNDATSARIDLQTNVDRYYPVIVTFSTKLYDPKLLGTKSVLNLSAPVEDQATAPAEPGDTLRYVVPVENIGLDTAAHSRFFDAIPTGTTYVPGSTTVDGVPQTDAVDTEDNTQLVADGNGHLLIHLGTGATPGSGGSIVPTSGAAQHVVTFDVVVDADVEHDRRLVNAASLTYRGLTTGAANASATNAVIRPVVGSDVTDEPPVAGSHILSFTPAPGVDSLKIPVLEGDVDPEGQPLDVVAVTQAAGGTVTINLDDTVTWTPRADFAGRDVFTYTIEDVVGHRSTATVTIELINTAPEAVDDAASVPASTPTVLDLLTNDSDPNGDALALRSVDATTAQGGTVTLVGVEATYTPADGFRGTDTFTYVVEDSRGGSDDATVTLTVTNNAPVAVDDGYATDAGTPVALDVLANDTDADDDTLTASVGTGPAHGSLDLDADGTGTYTPDDGSSGVDTFTYTVSDGQGGSDTATVTIAVNGAPVANADTDTTDGGTHVDVPVLDNDTDPYGGDPLTVSALTQPTRGSAAIQAGGAVRYTPGTGWAGVDTFTYTASDGSLTDTATVTVTTGNTAPVAVDDAASTPTDTPAAGIDVLGNDSDANVTAGIPGQALVVVGTPTADNGADVELAGDGTLTVTPAAGFAGLVTVTYVVGDGAGGTDTGTLRVTVDNAAPVAVPDGPTSTPTDTSVLLDVVANDTDPNGDTLTLDPSTLTDPVDGDGTVRGTVVEEGGQVRYTPPAGWSGTATFTYEASDGEGGVSTGTVTVVVENGTPVAVDDVAGTPSGTAVTVDVLANDTDPNIPGTDQELTVTAATADGGATVVVEVDGTLTVTPAPGFEGPVTVTYTVSDGAGGTDDGELVVTVANAAPVAVDETATTPYRTPVEVDLLTNDADANPGDTLTVVPGSLSLPVDAGGARRGSVALSGGTATYTPPAGFSGVVTFTYAVTDGTDEVTATVTVTVGNAPPIPAPPTTVTTPPAGGGPITIDVTGDATDPDGGTPTLVSVQQPAHGTVEIVDGRIAYTPEPGWSGQVTITYTIEDGQGGTAVGTLTLVVPAAPADPTPADPTPPAPGPGAPAPDAPGPSSLARTGAEAGELMLLAVLLMVAGGSLVALRRLVTRDPGASAGG